MEIKISQLPAATTPADTDLYMVVQSGVSPNRKQTLAQLKAAIGAVSANLAALNELDGVADRLIYFTGPGAMSLAVWNAFTRSLLEKADAAQFRSAISVQPTADAAFTGTTKNQVVSVDNVSGIAKSFRMRTGGVDRYAISCDSSVESGSNVGSDFLIVRYSDAGASLGRLISATRSTGNISVGNAAPDATAQLLVNGASLATGPVRAGQYTLATLPSAATYNGYEIDVTNATGGPKRCRSNGSVWQILNTTTTVS